MAHPYDDRYQGDMDRGERGRHGGFLGRAGEEVRSWFGRPDRDRMRERGSSGEPWQGPPPRGSGEYRPDEPDRPASRGWNEPEYGSRSMSGYGDGDRYGRDYGREGEPRWDDRSPRDRDWGAVARPHDSDWGPSRWARDDEARYGDWWAQRQRDWRYENPPPRQGRTAGEARGIYEDDSGRVHQFAHRPEMSFAGRGPKGYRRADERIREDVCERLTEDWRIDATDIDVMVNNGEVTLAGAVQTREEKRGAEDLVEHVSGVRDVHNNLRVSRSEGGGPNTTTTSATPQAPPTSGSAAAGPPRR